jgi:hypothetical protein
MEDSPAPAHADSQLTIKRIGERVVSRTQPVDLSSSRHTKKARSVRSGLAVFVDAVLLFVGAEGQNRTGDTVIFSHVLYRLSYLGSLLAGNPRSWAIEDSNL